MKILHVGNHAWPHLCVHQGFKIFINLFFFSKNYASLYENLYIIALFFRELFEKHLAFNAMRNELNSYTKIKTTNFIILCEFFVRFYSIMIFFCIFNLKFYFFHKNGTKINIITFFVCFWLSCCCCCSCLFVCISYRFGRSKEFKLKQGREWEQRWRHRLILMRFVIVKWAAWSIKHQSQSSSLDVNAFFIFFSWFLYFPR